MSDWERIGVEVGRLVAAKQEAYGDSFGKAGQIMRILYGESIPAEKLDDALTVVRVLDKLFRVASRKDAFGESPWRDVIGYALLAVARDERAAAPRVVAEADCGCSYIEGFGVKECATCRARKAARHGG